MSAAAAVRVPHKKETRKLELWREGGFTAFQHKWMPHMLAITSNHTQIGIVMLILRETEGSRAAVPNRAELPPAAEWSPAISAQDFADWCQCDPENIRIQIKTLLADKVIERNPLGQLFRYRCRIEAWDRLAEKRRSEYKAALEINKEEREAEAEEDSEPAQKVSNPPRKFGGFGKAFVATAGFRSEAATIPPEAKRLAFEVPKGNLIILPQIKNDVMTIQVRVNESAAPPHEIMGGENGKSSHFNHGDLNVLREMLNRSLRSKLGPVDDHALHAIMKLVAEEQYPDLAARIRARLRRATSWGLVIELAKDVAHAAAKDKGTHIEVTDEDLVQLEEFRRRQEALLVEES